MATRIKRDIFTGEVVEETYDPSPRGRTLIYKEAVSPALVQGRAGQTRAYTDVTPHISKSLGVPTAQVDRFNAELDNFGVSGARYSKKSGFLESTDDNSRHAAWAIRGHFNPDGGNNADKWANALGY